jgi:RNA polymerase sigma factor (sigma-70 family)
MRLMERVQKGDKEAFQSLFDDIGPLITLFARRRAFAQAEIDDVCQEALLAVFKSRHTYELARPFEPWVFTIVRNITATHLRRTRQRARWHEPQVRFRKPAPKTSRVWASNYATD